MNSETPNVAAAGGFSAYPTREGTNVDLETNLAAAQLTAPGI
jgi:hypothetical protein